MIIRAALFSGGEFDDSNLHDWSLKRESGVWTLTCDGSAASHMIDYRTDCDAASMSVGKIIIGNMFDPDIDNPYTCQITGTFQSLFVKACFPCT